MTEYKCQECGKIFLAESGKAWKFCSDECRLHHKREYNKAYKARMREEQLAIIEANKRPTLEQRMKHQHDMSVWGRSPNEYADRQKARTLELMGKIEVSEYDMR